MKNPETGKRFVALSAAVAIGLGGVALTAPAIAANEGPEALGVAVATAHEKNDQIAAVGYNADRDIVVQVVAGSEVRDSDLEPVAAFAKADTGQEDLIIEEIANGYSVEQDTPATTVDSDAAAANADDLVGGAGYLVTKPGGTTAEGLCSVGFPATGPEGEDAILTAGHCSESGNEIYLEQPSASNAGTGDYTGKVTTGWLTTSPVGTFTHSKFAETILDQTDPDWDNPNNYDPAKTQDFAVVTLDDAAGITTHAQVTDWASAASDDLSSSTREVAGVHNVTSDDIGNEMWRSGRTSAKQDGKIGGEDEGVIGSIVDGYGLVAVPVPEGAAPKTTLVYGFAAEALGIPGDSGGAVMMGDQAVGVTSASNYNPDTGEGDWIWVAELAEGLKNLPGDYEVKTTADEEEPPETPEPTEDPTTPAPTPTDTDSPEPTEDPTTPAPTPTDTDSPEPTPTDTGSPEPTPTDTDSPEPTETATDEPTTPAPTPSETEEADEDAELSVDPREIAAEQFLAEDEDQAIDEDRGVTYSVTGAEPGSDVTFDTYASTDSASANAGSEEAPAEDSNDAPAKSVTVTADEDGNASSRVWGLPTAPAEAYIGDYEVIVTAEGETLESSFEVVGEGGGDGGQDDGDNGEGGDDLPRTGSTTAPLAAGAAGLVALGGALVYVARRRKA